MGWTRVRGSSSSTYKGNTCAALTTKKSRFRWAGCLSAGDEDCGIYIIRVCPPSNNANASSKCLMIIFLHIIIFFKLISLHDNIFTAIIYLHANLSTPMSLHSNSYSRYNPSSRKSIFKLKSLHANISSNRQATLFSRFKIHITMLVRQSGGILACDARFA